MPKTTMNAEEVLQLLKDNGITVEEASKVIRTEKRLRDAEIIQWDSKTNQVAIPSDFFALKIGDTLTNKGFLRAGRTSFVDVIFQDKRRKKQVRGALMLQAWVVPEDVGVDPAECKVADNSKFARAAK